MEKKQITGIICIYRGFKESADKLLKLILKIDGSSKVIEDKFNIRNLVAFLYVCDK